MDHTKLLLASGYLYKQVPQDREESFCVLGFGLLLLLVSQHLLSEGPAEVQSLEHRVGIAGVAKLSSECQFSFMYLASY